MLKTLRDLLELEWGCARFQERTLREKLRDVLENRDVQSCILAWPARAGLVVLPLPLALDSGAVRRERIVSLRAHALVDVLAGWVGGGAHPRGSDLQFFDGGQGQGQNPSFFENKGRIRRFLFERVKSVFSVFICVHMCNFFSQHLDS